MNTLRVGIVGAAGQVGSALLKALDRNDEFSAVGIVRNSVAAARIASQGMEARIAQTDNPVGLLEATRDLDALVNCALPRYQPSKTSAANHGLANSLAHACAGKHLLHLSSVAVYGDFISGSRGLFGHPRPDIVYGRQKLQMENLLRKFTVKHSVKCTILRVGHVYGPELRWSEAIFDLIKTENFRLPFGGDIPSNGVWIANLIAGIQEVLIRQAPQGTVNLTDIPQMTWRDVFELHANACGSPAVKPMSKLESKRRFMESKEKSQTGIGARLILETLTWLKHLPASYIASVPSFKAMAQVMIGNLNSEKLDAKLYATYSRHLFQGIEANSGPEISGVFLSEPVPGPCLSYQGRPPVECRAALKDWHDSISEPHANASGTMWFPRQVAN